MVNSQIYHEEQLQVVDQKIHLDISIYILFKKVMYFIVEYV